MSRSSRMQNLTQDEWREAMALLDQVLDLDPSQQQEALQASDAPEKIRTAIARMLAQEADEDDVLDRGAFDLIAPVVEDDDRFDDTAVRALETLSSGTGLRARPGDLEKGMVIGAYRIEGLLGRGGMGEVYLAERADDAYTQKVALKLVRVQGLGSGEVEARFRRERQILAGLRHEHIARLLDGGVTERGRPFLVMEYVDGQTITTYADENALNVDQRLELFEQACRAVQYAHRRAIIHRDLKPTNLIVEERRAGGDGQSGTVRPVAKLLDFGIAKLLEAETTEEALTRADERLMTPEYAAPEQISGDAVTTATDVYQLGALMYELLTGQRPFYEVTEGKSGRSRIRAAEDAILQTEPENPSQVLTRNAETIQRTHGTDFQHLIGRVRGDLDAIVRKALRKDPAGRYDSVSDLLDDLRRYRDGRPVEARRGTWTYRTKKFIRRNRTPVILGTAVAALIAAFVVSLMVQTNRLETALADVRAESERREEVQDLFTSILDVAEPSPEYRDTLTVRDMLNRSAEQAYMQFADHPRLKAWTYTRLTSYEYNLGEYERAIAFGDSALAVYDSLHIHATDDRFAITNEYASALGMTAAALRELDRIDEALTLRERAVSVITGRQRSRGQARLAGAWFQSSVPEKDQLISEIEARMNYLSVVEMMDRTRAHAEVDTINTLIRRFRDAGGSAENETLLFEYGTLAGYYLDEGAFDVADSLFTKTLSFREEKFGHISQEVETILNNRIAMFVRMGDYRKAYDVASEALSIGRQIYGNDHPTLRPTLNHVGNALINLDRHEEAVPYFREALRISRTEFGIDHDNTLDARLRLANAYNSMGNPERAVPILQDVLRVYNAKYGSKANLTIGVRVNLAAALRQVGATDDALRQHRLVLETARRLYPENPTAEEVKTIEYRQIARPYIAILRSYSLLLEDLGRHRQKCQIMAEYDQVYRDSDIGQQMYGQSEGTEIRQFLEGCDRSQLS